MFCSRNLVCLPVYHKLLLEITSTRIISIFVTNFLLIISKYVEYLKYKSTNLSKWVRKFVVLANMISYEGPFINYVDSQMSIILYNLSTKVGEGLKNSQNPVNVIFV